MKLPPLNIRDYTYELPSDRIAMFPLPERDEANILCYKNGNIKHNKFNQLPDLLPVNSILFFNDTKVIPARILFEKETGATIEIFLIQPGQPNQTIASALSDTNKSIWKCTIGNLKRWPDGVLLKKTLGAIDISATLLDRQAGLVEFTWTPLTAVFAEVVQLAGTIPLPPYIKRDVVASDRERYQTVYSNMPGAVAAPTAGLHFTEKTLKALKSRDFLVDFLSLHVGAGTFLPVKVENAAEHHMHEEQIIIQRHTLENLLLPGKKVIAVGTTSLRTLESLFWYGVQLLEDPKATFNIPSSLPYQPGRTLPSTQEAIKAVLNLMDRQGLEELPGRTSIYILPGYNFHICDGLITNFHQPGSTLLLLIAAFIGTDWQRVYHEALDNGYRFLSYGDSSLLLRG